MATFLDLGLVQHFSVIFPVLLVFVLVFAILEKTKVFGENKGLHGIIALCLAIMLLFIPGVVEVISTMAPWFILIFLFLVFMLLLLMALGTKWDTIVGYASGSFDIAHWIILILLIIVFLGSIGAVYGNTLLPYSGGKVVVEENASMPSTLEGPEGTTTDTGDFNANVGRVIFHPRVLGFLLILIIGSLTIKMLSSTAKK